MLKEIIELTYKCYEFYYNNRKWITITNINFCKSVITQIINYI